MRAGEIREKTNITRDTLRHYVDMGLIKPTVNSKNSYKIYSDEDIDLIEFIKQAKCVGFTLADIKRLSKEVNSVKCKHKALLPELRERLAHLSKKIKTIKKIESHLTLVISEFESKDCDSK